MDNFSLRKRSKVRTCNLKAAHPSERKRNRILFEKLKIE